MGWSISVITNTVHVSDECAKDLFEAQRHKNEYWYDIEDVSYKNTLSFNSDHMEHMDYLAQEHLQNVLKKHKVDGIVVFLSADGDNSGTMWAYDFDGNGGMTKYYINLAKEYRRVFAF